MSYFHGSKSKGIPFDSGVMPRFGEDPVGLYRDFGRRDQINQVHIRDVRVQTPRQKYTEIFINEGHVNLFAIMKEFVRQKYPRLVFPKHRRGLDADRAIAGSKPQYPGRGTYIGYTHIVGYARAMIQAALASQKGLPTRVKTPFESIEYWSW